MFVTYKNSEGFDSQTLSKVEYCCPHMSENVTEGVVFIAPSLAIAEEWSETEGGHQYVCLHYDIPQCIDIDFCPWCGSKIEGVLE